MFCLEFSLAFSSSIIVCLLAQNISFVSGNSYGSKINFYNGKTVGTFTSHDLTKAENVVNDPLFNLNRTTVIFIHGWNQSPTSNGSQVILNAYIFNGKYNILMLDWSDAASDAFTTVQSKVDEIGIELALFVDRINVQKGLQFSKLHLVGHSLGAHLAGKVGKYTLGWSGQTKHIDRITGLDPANFFSDILNWRHARFVDIIHTNAGGYGMNQHSGHVDFFPNGGVTGMSNYSSDSTSNHVRSMYFWAESVRRGQNITFLSINRYNPKIVIQMGNNCPTRYVQGEYDLSTRDSPWFSKTKCFSYHCLINEKQTNSSHCWRWN